METQSEVEVTGAVKEEDTRTCLTEPDRYDDDEAWMTSQHQTCRIGGGARLDSIQAKGYSTVRNLYSEFHN